MASALIVPTGPLNPQTSAVGRKGFIVSSMVSIAIAYPDDKSLTISGRHVTDPPRGKTVGCGVWPTDYNAGCRRRFTVESGRVYNRFLIAAQDNRSLLRKPLIRNGLPAGFPGAALNAFTPCTMTGALREMFSRRRASRQRPCRIREIGPRRNHSGRPAHPLDLDRRT
jgi:hypothetical protein